MTQDLTICHEDQTRIFNFFRDIQLQKLCQLVNQKNLSAEANKAQLLPLFTAFKLAGMQLIIFKHKEEDIQ